MVSLGACWKFHEDLQKAANPRFKVSGRPFYQEYSGNCYVDVDNKDIETRHPGDMKSMGTVWMVKPKTFKNDSLNWVELGADVPIAYDSEPSGKMRLESTGSIKVLVEPPPEFQRRLEACGCKVDEAHWHGDNSTHAHVKCSVEKRRCFVKEVLREVRE